MSESIVPSKPWVTPDDVRAYSELESVQKRSDERLAVDISRAEAFVYKYTHNNFEGYTKVPDEVKTAVIILAEAYAYNAIESTKSVRSETFDDYSYTSENTVIDFDNLGYEALLDKYVLAVGTGRVTLRMRKL